MATKCEAVPYLYTFDSDTSQACSSAHSTKFSKEKAINKEHKNYRKSTYPSAQSSLCGEGDSGVINCADPVSLMEPASQEVTNGGAESAQPGNSNSQGLGEKKPTTWKDIIDDIPSEPERVISEECLTKNSTEEEFLTPGKGGVSKDISRLTNRSLVDLGVVDARLDIKHLSKETQRRIRGKMDLRGREAKLVLLMASSMIYLLT